jgi:voltage-gated potassium channel
MKTTIIQNLCHSANDISPNWRDYFFRQWGWLDLLGSVPIAFGPLWIAVLRLARLPRLVSITRDLRAKDSEQIKRELRGDPKTALLFTILLSVVMITVAGVVILQIEGHSPQANIRSGADAFWWAFVTITTVGYGDLYPTSGPGRLMAMILMMIGVSIFAVLTSFLASFLVGKDDGQPDTPSLQDEMKALRQENAAMREQLDVVIKTLAPKQLDEG